MSYPDLYLDLIAYATHFPAEWYQPEINTLANNIIRGSRERWHFGGILVVALAGNWQWLQVSAARVRNGLVAGDTGRKRQHI
jgi:hypothetical protein